MKRNQLLKHLRIYGFELLREGGQTLMVGLQSHFLAKLHMTIFCPKRITPQQKAKAWIPLNLSVDGSR